MRYCYHKNGNIYDNTITNVEVREFTPLSQEEWLERYGEPLPEGYRLALCSPELGCNDRICFGWKVVRDA